MANDTTPRSLQLKRDRVRYVVTREEYYVVEAISADDAEQRAFEEGELVDSGDTTDMTLIDVAATTDQGGSS